MKDTRVYRVTLGYSVSFGWQRWCSCAAAQLEPLDPMLVDRPERTLLNESKLHPCR